MIFVYYISFYKKLKKIMYYEYNYKILLLNYYTMFRTVKPSVIPQFIKINEFTKYKVSILSKSCVADFSLPQGSFEGNTIDVNKFLTLTPRYNNVSYLDVSKNKKLAHDINLIEQSISMLGTKHKDVIKEDILELSWFNNYFNYWNITNIARKYNLTSKNIIINLADKENIVQNEIFDLDQMFDLAINTHQMYVYINRFNNHNIINNFPVDMNNNDTPLNFNIKQYNAKNFDTGFNKIINMMLSNTPITYKKYEPEFKLYTEDTNNFISQTAISEHNSKLSSYIFTKLKNNDNNIDKTKIYKMQLFYDTYVKTKLNYCELLYWFDYNTNITTKRSDDGNRSVVNALIYGKSCVLEPTDLDKILSYVLTSKNNKQTQIDNYIVKNNNEISWNDYIDILQPAVSDQQKFDAITAIITLMDNVDPIQLNKVNYKMLNDYLKKYTDVANVFETILNKNDFILLALFFMTMLLSSK